MFVDLFARFGGRIKFLRFGFWVLRILYEVLWFKILDCFVFRLLFK